MNILPTQETLEKIRAVNLPKRLLIDYSSLAYKTAYGCKEELLRTGFTDWRVFKYYMLDFIIEMKLKLGAGTQVIIGCDRKVDGDYWRATIFPGYKKVRDTRPQEIPKDILKKNFLEFQQELEDNFPFKFVYADKAEADDVIAILAHDPAYCDVIVTADFDLYQLVDQKTKFFFSVMKGYFMEGPEKDFFKFEKVIRGDSSDNISNIESDLDAIVDPLKRQKRLTNTKFQEYWMVYKQHGESIFINYLREDQRKRYSENKNLMDLDLIPEDIKTAVLNKIADNNLKGNGSTAFKYAMSHSFSDIASKITRGGF